MMRLATHASTVAFDQPGVSPKRMSSAGKSLVEGVPFARFAVDRLCSCRAAPTVIPAISAISPSVRYCLGTTAKPNHLAGKQEEVPCVEAPAFGGEYSDAGACHGQVVYCPCAGLADVVCSVGDVAVGGPEHELLAGYCIGCVVVGGGCGVHKTIVPHWYARMQWGNRSEARTIQPIGSRRDEVAS